ncbi:MAG: glutamate--tRNA ligase [Hyphomicrobiaceae bacterium]|nr:MAG: glutamate--tRNA ligase [Hyphomicrobiaceae bacterium]
MTVTVRFAPSPTGRLHIGNIRAAVLAWLFARKSAGTFILRIDDTDVARSTEEHVAGIREDLSWLGLVWDREERQSARFARYAAVVEELKEAGRLYACYETAEELERRRKRRRAAGQPPIYDRAGLRLSDVERRRLEAEGRRPHWRFLLQNYEQQPDRIQPTLVAWHDIIRGEQMVDLGSLSDPVLVREDGGYLYTLASVIDDADFGISHVIRGEDHVTNTAVQIDIFRALGAREPQFAHHSLLVGSDGEALSKRIGSLSIETLRKTGVEPGAITSLLAAIGSSDPVVPALRPEALAPRFDLAKLSRAPVRFDEAELEAINARLLHEMPFAEAAARLAPHGTLTEDLWNAVKGNIKKLDEALEWAKVTGEAILPVIEDADVCQTAASLLPPEPWDTATWGRWTEALKAATERKGRALFHPLRLALTARESGPELKLLLPLIGRDRALKRLQGSKA